MKRKGYRPYILIILWIVVIFAFSSQSGLVSNGISLSISRTILGDIFGISNIHIQSVVNFIIRKAGHFFVYFVLGTIVLHICDNIGISQGKAFVMVITIGCICAAADEFYQSFIPGRTSLIRDIFIDIFGILMSFLCFRAYKGIKS